MSVGISVKGMKPYGGTNFQGWTAQMNPLFVMNDVLDVVDGTMEPPTSGEVTRPHRRKCERRSNGEIYYFVQSRRSATIVRVVVQFCERNVGQIVLHSRAEDRDE